MVPCVWKGVSCGKGLYGRGIHRTYGSNYLIIKWGMAFVKLVHTLKWARCVFNPYIKCELISSNIGGVFKN